MKPTVIKTIINLNLLLLLLAVVSCKKDKFTLNNNETINNDASIINNGFASLITNQISVESNYLYFINPNDFNKTIKILEEMNEEELNSWGSNFSGFESMHTKYRNNLVMDTLHFWKLQYIDSLPQNAYVTHADEIRASRYMYLKYYFKRQSNQYEDYTDDSYGTEEYVLVKNINRDVISAVVNPQGIVRVGDSIYLFKRNYTKRILASTPGKIDKLLYSNDSAMRIAPINSFKVLGIESCDQPSNFSSKSWSATNSEEFSSNPKYHLTLKVEYYPISDYDCNALYTPHFKVIVISEIKKWFEFVYQPSLNYKSLEIYYTINHPNGTVSNESWMGSVSSGTVYQFLYSKSYPLIDSRSFTSMFSISNVSARATMSAGSSGGATTLSH